MTSHKRSFYNLKWGQVCQGLKGQKTLEFMISLYCEKKHKLGLKIVQAVKTYMTTL